MTSALNLIERIMQKKQIELMVCPECNAKLNYEKIQKELVCETCQLAFPVKDGIPVMLIDEARQLDKA